MALDCCPKTFTGFCLTDNTPIAITLNSGVIISWTNLVTGVVTPGNPPAGTGICDVPSTVTIEIEPLTCIKDSVTVCPPIDDAPFHVVIDNAPPGVNLDCLTDSVTICTDDPIEVFGIISGTVALDALTLTALETTLGQRTISKAPMIAVLSLVATMTKQLNLARAFVASLALTASVSKFLTAARSFTTHLTLTASGIVCMAFDVLNRITGGGGGTTIINKILSMRMKR